MILDTNALSAFAEGMPPVVQHIASADELHVPAIVLGEIGQSRALLCAREREVTIVQFEHKITKKPRFSSAKTKNLGYLRFLVFKEKSKDFNRR